MASPYKSLDSSSTQIRLLRLLPLHRTSDDSISDNQAQPWHSCTNIECTLVISSLEAAPAYDALSYAWGCEDDGVQITVNGATTLARSNLAYALAALRASEARLLWIDALCIDQKNNHERNHQVRLMGEIYRKAKQVLVWLGRPGLLLGSRVADAVQLLERFGDLPPQSSLVSWPPEPDLPHEDHFERWIEDLRRRSGSRKQHIPRRPKEMQREDTHKPTPLTNRVSSLSLAKWPGQDEDSSTSKWSLGTWFKTKIDGALRKHPTSTTKRAVEYPLSNIEETRKLLRQYDSSMEMEEMELLAELEWNYMKNDGKHISEMDWVAEKKWLEMKEDREMRERRRQRLPEIIDELKASQPFLAQKQQELAELQALQSRQQEDLKALQLLQKQGLRRLDDIVRRPLLQFKARQAQAIAEGRTLWQDASWESQKRDDEELQEQQHEKQQEGLDDQGKSSGQDLQSRESILGQISEQLRALQSYILDRRQELAAKRKWSGLDLADEWNKLEKLQRLDEDERRKLQQLREQLNGLLQLENNQDDALLQLENKQDVAFEKRMRAWDHAIEAALKTFRSKRDFKPKQCKALQNLTQHQLQVLKDLRASFEGQWTQSLSFEPQVQPPLTPDELSILRQLKAQRRQVHRQRVVLRETQIQSRAVARLLEQYAKWTERVYETKRKIPTVAGDELETRQKLLDAQSAWVREWRSLSTKEWDKWQSRTMGPTYTKYKSWDILLLTLTDICDLSYWSRLWIVQEILLAKDLVLCFGDDARTSTSWDVLTKARHSLSQIPTFWPCDPAINRPLDMIKHSLPFQLDRLRERFGDGWSLHSLLEITENSQCKEPRDKIYGLLGLANDYEVGDIDISYSKPIGDVYQDMIRWYYKPKRTQESSVSLVRFSQTIQMSFKAHSQVEAGYDSSALFNLAQSPSPLSTETFFMEAILKGPILPIENNIHDGQLIGLHQRDWVSVMLDYIVSNNQFRTQKDAIERELIHLDSITTTFAIPTSSPVFVTSGIANFGSEDQCAQQQVAFNKLQGKGEEKIFFATADGEFGVASTRIREDDRLCRFKDSQFSLILRRSGNGYILVSKAIISLALTDVLVRSLPHQQTPDRLTIPLMEDIQPAPKEATQSAIQVDIDLATLQHLTMPSELSTKHIYREPSCVYEANFGWYEFITFGLDVSPSGLAKSRMPNLFVVEASNGIKRRDVTSVRDMRRKVRVANVSGEGSCATSWRQRRENGLGAELELGNFWKLDKPILIWAH